MNAQLIKEVLRPRPGDAVFRMVRPASVEAGTFQAQLVDDAAAAVRQLYYRGQRRVGYDANRPEGNFDACVDTFITTVDVEQNVTDERTAALAMAIFERAGFFRELLRPTTPAARDAIKSAVVQAAERVRWLSAEQALAS